MEDLENQGELNDLWEDSNPDALLEDRREQGGWIIEDPNTGIYSFQPFPDDWTRTACGIDVPPDFLSDVPSDAVGWVHTHPYDEETDTSSICSESTDDSYESSPSRDDVILSTIMSSQVNEPPLRGYVLDGDHLVPYDVAGQLEPFDRCGY